MSPLPNCSILGFISMSLVAFWFRNLSQYELSVVAHKSDGAQAVPTLDVIEVTRK